jgi:hypothetical protein
MSADTFREALQALLRGAAESGLDVFFIHNELSLAGMQLVDECRVDLVVSDEEDDPLR